MFQQINNDSCNSNNSNQYLYAKQQFPQPIYAQQRQKQFNNISQQQQQQQQQQSQQQQFKRMANTQILNRKNPNGNYVIQGNENYKKTYSQSNYFNPNIAKSNNNTNNFNSHFNQNNYTTDFNQYNNPNNFSTWHNLDQCSEISTSYGSEENNSDDFLDQKIQSAPSPPLLLQQSSIAGSSLLNQNSNLLQQQNKNCSNTNGKINGVSIPEEAKYKTEMCKNWVDTGKCNYGEKCKFAHGKQELVQKLAANKLFKTKQCKQYFENSICSYGHRCHFLHVMRSVSEIVSQNYFYKRLLNPELELSQPKDRLEIFQRLTSSTSSLPFTSD